MGCCRCVSIAVALLAVVLGTGLLSHVVLQLAESTKSSTIYGLVGAFPLLVTNRSAAGLDEIPKGALDGQTCVVTGGNAGLGYVTSEQLAVKGCNVVVAGRRQKAIVEACGKIDDEIKQSKSNGSCEPMQVDVSSLKSVRAFTKAFMETHKRLDVIVLNAGIAFLAPTAPFLSEDGIEVVYATNHVGHFAMIQDLEGIIAKTGREQSFANIVVVSSSVHYDCKNSTQMMDSQSIVSSERSSLGRMDLYSRTKLANVLMARSLAQKLKKDNVVCNSVHPGVVSTNVLDPLFEQLAKSGVEYPLFRPVLEFAGKAFRFFEHQLFFEVREGARTQVWAAASPSIRQGMISGKYYHPQKQEIAPNSLVDETKDGILLQDRLWAFTEKLIKEIEG